MKRYRIEAFVKADKGDEDELEELLREEIKREGWLVDSIAVYEVML